VFALAAVVFAWRARARLVFAPLAASGVHLALAAHVVPAPRSPLEWGAALVGLGFVLLLASLGASYGLSVTAARAASSRPRE
jgi:hypothetical protein